MSVITDMFIRIKNAQSAGRETVHIPYSKFKHEIARVLERSGFVGTVERRGKRVRKTLEIALHADEAASSIVHDVRFLSRPSRRAYISYRDIHPSRHGGIVILSTPRGVMTGDEARKAKVGGELIAEVW